jgi:uncharacterized protein YcfJ
MAAAARTVSAWCATVLWAVGASAEAQMTASSDSLSRPAIGDRVSLRTQPLGERRARAQCDARVTGVSRDTLLLAHTNSSRLCPPWVYAPEQIATLQVAAGRDRGSRAGHAFLGLGAGAVIGGVAGFAIGHASECSGCDFNGLVTAVGVIAGGSLGGLTGLIVGLAVPAGPRWRNVPVTGPVQVTRAPGGPELRVGLRR